MLKIGICEDNKDFSLDLISNYRSLKYIPYNLVEKQFYEIYRGIMINLNHVKDFIIVYFFWIWS